MIFFLSRKQKKRYTNLPNFILKTEVKLMFNPEKYPSTTFNTLAFLPAKHGNLITRKIIGTKFGIS